MQLPFVTAPTEKIRTVGNDAVGTIAIRSIGAMTGVETDYFEANQISTQAELAKVAKDAMNRTDRKYSWDAVLEAVKSAALNTELQIPELERTAVEFSKWFDETTARNNAIAAVAIMRNRVAGCAEMTIAQFEDDAIVPPGIRAKLVEFAINESNGWPKEQATAPKVESAPAAPAMTEAEAAK